MKLEHLHQWWSQRLGQNVCIAGGAVRDTLMGRTPKDFDVFCQSEIDVSSFDGLEMIEGPSWHRYEPFLRGTFRWENVEVQVMVTQHESAESLLEGFDWNVCLFAFDGKHHAIETIDNIGVGKDLRLHKVTKAASTLRRGYRFSERFVMRFPWQSQLQLMRQVVEEADQKAAVNQ